MKRVISILLLLLAACSVAAVAIHLPDSRVFLAGGAGTSFLAIAVWEWTKKS